MTLHPAHRTFKKGKRKEGKAWIVCMVSVICTCLFVHTSRDENCNFSSTIGTLCYGLWYTVTIPNKYFLHRAPLVISFLFLFLSKQSACDLRGTGRTFRQSLSQQVYSPADLLSRDKTSQFCAYLRGFNSQTRCTHTHTQQLTLILLSATRDVW